MDIQTALRQPDVAIIDVREPFDFNDHHVEGALNIPLQSIPNRLDEFRQMSGPIVLYCRSGSRSGMATNYLKSNGFSQVYNGGSVGQMEMFLLPHF